MLQWTLGYMYPFRSCFSLSPYWCDLKTLFHRIVTSIFWPLWRTVWKILKKLNIELLYYHAIPLLGIYPEKKKKKTLIWKDICTPLFIAALFTIATTQKQSKYPLTEEWIKMWNIYVMEYYSNIKKNEIMSFVTTWMDLEIVILSKVSQKERDNDHISHICEI